MENLNRRKWWLWFPIRFTFYEIEKKYDDIELKINSGLLSKKVEKIKLFKIQDISYSRSLGNLICGVGNVKLLSGDVSTPVITITKIKKAKEFMEKLEKMIHEERTRVGVVHQESNIIHNPYMR